MGRNSLVFSDSEKDFIKENIKDISVYKMAHMLDRSVTAIWNYANTLPEYRKQVAAKRSRDFEIKEVVKPKKRDERPPAVYSNRSPYGIASPGI